MKQQTITDIAKALGVSTTTVHKALHGTGQLRPETREKILAYAKKVDYTPNIYAQSLVKKEAVIAYVASGETPEYHEYIQKGIYEAFDEYKKQKVRGKFYQYGGSNTYDEILEILDQISRDDEVSALILNSRYQDAKHIAAIRKIAERHVPVLSIGSRLALCPVSGYIMSDGIMMGKMAAEFLALARVKKAAVIVPNRDSEMHNLCIDGFRGSEFAQGIEMTGVYETGYHQHAIAEATEQAVRRTPDIDGIYVASYYSMHVCSYLKQYGLAQKITVIGHDLHPRLADCLRDGSLNAVLFQNQRQQARLAVQKLLDYLNVGIAITSTYSYPQLILRSNLEGYQF